MQLASIEATSEILAELLVKPPPQKKQRVHTHMILKPIDECADDLDLLVDSEELPESVANQLQRKKQRIHHQMILKPIDECADDLDLIWDSDELPSVDSKPVWMDPVAIVDEHLPLDEPTADPKATDDASDPIWLPIPGYVDVEMNSNGIARKISTKKVFTVYNSAIQLDTCDGRRVSRGVRKIKGVLFQQPVLEGERWKPIDSFESHEISTHGRIRGSVDKFIRSPMRSKGYCRIKLRETRFMVHTLVAKAFVPAPNRPDQNTVNHINGVRHDNRVENLEWASQSEQLLHAHRAGLINVSRINRRVSLVVNGEHTTIFASLTEASRSTGISAARISRVCNGIRPSTSGLTFVYVDPSTRRISTIAQDLYAWLSVPGFPKYEICAEGIVRHASTHILLSIQHIKDDYDTVTLCNHEGKVPKPLHILLANAFLPNPLSLPVVHHRDENKKNNRLENLQWVTQQQNTEASIGKVVVQYDDEMKVIRSWPSIAKAAVEVGLPKSTLSRYLIQFKNYKGLQYAPTTK